MSGWKKLNDACWGAKGHYSPNGKYLPLYTVFRTGESERGTTVWEAWKAGKLIADGLKTRDEAMLICKNDSEMMEANDQLKPPRVSAVGLEAPVGREDGE